MTDERKEGQLKPLNIKDDRPDYEWNGEFDQDALDRGVKAAKERRAAQPEPRRSEALRRLIARWRRAARVDCSPANGSHDALVRGNAIGNCADELAALAAATAERTPPRRLRHTDCVNRWASMCADCQEAIRSNAADRQPASAKLDAQQEPAKAWLEYGYAEGWQAAIEAAAQPEGIAVIAHSIAKDYLKSRVTYSEEPLVNLIVNRIERHIHSLRPSPAPKEQDKA